MPTFTRINFNKLFGTSAPDPNNLQNQANLGVASFLYYDLINNGFKLIYPTNATNNGPNTLGIGDIYNASQVVFEAQGPTANPTHNVDPLGDTQAWRIGFIVGGYQNNQLQCFIGTASTMGDGTNSTPTGINQYNSISTLLVQGGTTVAQTRISLSNLYTYTLTITPRGIALLVYENLKIEDMTHMGLVVIQRPVESDGTVLQTGYCPVFCLHNTNPDKAGLPQLDDRFFFQVVREVDKLLPTQPDLVAESNQRCATATYTFFQFADRAGPENSTYNASTVLPSRPHSDTQSGEMSDGARIEFSIVNPNISTTPYTVIFYKDVGTVVSADTNRYDARFYANLAPNEAGYGSGTTFFTGSNKVTVNHPVTGCYPITIENGYFNNATLVPGLSTDMANNAYLLANALSNIDDIRVQSCSYQSGNSDGNMYITSNTPGQSGNNIFFRTKAFGNLITDIKVTGTEWHAPTYPSSSAIPSPTMTLSGAYYPGVWGDYAHPAITNPTAGSGFGGNPNGSDGCVYLSGGGDAGQIPSGWFEIDVLPGNNDSITINGFQIKFRTQASINSGIPLDPTSQVPVASTTSQTALNIYAWLQNNASSISQLANATYTINLYANPPLNARIQVKLKTILDDTLGASFDITANTPAVPNCISVSTRSNGTTGLSASSSNQATGYIWFYSNPSGGEVLNLNGIGFQFLSQYANPLSWQVQINPTDLFTSSSSTLQVFMKLLSTSTNSQLQVANYTLYTASADITTQMTNAQNSGFQPPVSTPQAIIKIQYNDPGIAGNYYTTTTANIPAPPTIGVSANTLLNGNGVFQNESSFVFNTEVSDPLSSYGTTMYQVPRTWASPVTTDKGEYVLVFPFGFTSPRVAYIEEMDLVAISKGPAYQGVQPISISVYGQTRTYTALCSNNATQSNYVRVFLLTGGGGI